MKDVTMPWITIYSYPPPDYLEHVETKWVEDLPPIVPPANPWEQKRVTAASGDVLNIDGGNTVVVTGNADIKYMTNTVISGRVVLIFTERCLLHHKEGNPPTGSSELFFAVEDDARTSIGTIFEFILDGTYWRNKV